MVMLLAHLGRTNRAPIPLLVCVDRVDSEPGRTNSGIAQVMMLLDQIGES